MKVSVSGKQFVFPRCCACCGGFPMVTLSMSGSEKNRRSRTKGWLWEVPYCVSCRSHVKRAEGAMLVWISGVALAGFACFSLMALGSAVLPALVVGSGLTVGSSAGCAIFLVRDHKRLERDCSTVFRSVAYLGSAGVCHSFDMKSKSYATEFIRSNHRKIVNASPQVANILRGLSFDDSQTPRRLIRFR